TELDFQGRPPAENLAGARVRVHGLHKGKVFMVAAGSTQQLPSTSSTAPTTPATGARKVAVVLFNFSNDTTQPYTPAFVGGVAFTNTNSVAAYYAENSWGQLTLNGDVFGWYTIADTDLTCNFSHWANAATTIAAAAGVDL